jgi:hypothetical protein
MSFRFQQAKTYFSPSRSECLNISRAISLAVPSGGIAARGQSVKGTPDGGAFRMGISKCHKLLIATAEVAAQFFMVMVAVVPAPVIQYQRREDDPRHFPADSLLKPVVRIAQVTAAAGAGKLLPEP